jgi:hypothetical protein
MEFVIPSIEDYIRPAVIATKLYAMTTSPILSARNPVKSVVIIQNTASYIISLIRHVLRIILSLVHIADGARYHV